ncbi:helix-turn-helix domain-containing protein [Dysosmobacter sp.]|uniref:helix-turn-helix domain-containing protein n=1 Tax=Dysosmobacter sp. TaxID=2591382 RepID=UPI003AF54AF3
MSTNTPNEKGTPQSRTYTVNDIAAILGIGRATAYKLANSGAFKTIRIGNMIRISRKGAVNIYAQIYLQAPAE